MLDQLFNIVRNIGQRTVANNPEVPKEHTENIMADATGTIASGFQNVIAGGGFGSILDLFKRKNRNAQAGTGSGLLHNPIISMMIGYFISKLVGKYKMSPSAANNVAQEIIPGSVNKLVEQTNDPNDRETTLDRLVHSLTNGNGNTQSEELQVLLEREDKPVDSQQDGFHLKDMIGNLASKAQQMFQGPQKGTAGWSGLLKGLIHN